jgi:hypothetical protein
MAAHQPWRPESLRQRRYNVTRASNCVRDSIGYLLKPLPADTVFYRDGLPSWWSFWSDSLKDRVRELVRHARHLDPTLGTATVTALTFAEHQRQDPHCTCNGCIEDHAARLR